MLVQVDSPGGDVGAAFEAHDALRDCGLPVVTYVRKAHSAATVVMLAGDYIVAAPGASIMTHRVTGGTGPDQRRGYDARLAQLYIENVPSLDADVLVSQTLNAGDLDRTPASWSDETADLDYAFGVAAALARGATMFSPRLAALGRV